jgi:hypothetical protein
MSLGTRLKKLNIYTKIRLSVDLLMNPGIGVTAAREIIREWTDLLMWIWIGFNFVDTCTDDCLMLDTLFFLLVPKLKLGNVIG